MKKLFILGSTGSIGTSTLNVCAQHPDLYKVIGLVAHRNWELLLKQAEQFRPEFIVLTSAEAYQKFNSHYQGAAKIFNSFEDILRIIRYEEFDIVVNALVGAQGLLPTIEALKQQKHVALANKESLVIAGKLITNLLDSTHARLLPVDSEHSAIWQVLEGEKKENIRRLILTASGGPFRDKSLEEMKKATVEQALAHPTWNMGPKITIDSATMMNKALEIIEAYWLFRIPFTFIDVVIHKESIIHSMVEFVDGSIKAQMGYPDMRIPIAYALTYPDRVPLDVQFMEFAQTTSLHFQKPDLQKFKALTLAYEALKASATHPAVLNAANEVAVQAFLERKIGFLDIVTLVETMLEKHEGKQDYSLEQILEIDRLTREDVVHLIKNGVK